MDGDLAVGGVLTVQSLQSMCPCPAPGVGALSDREAKTEK